MSQQEFKVREIVSKIISNARVSEVLMDIAKLDSETVNRIDQQIDDDEITQLGMKISGSLSTSGVEATIVAGGLLFLYQRATDTDNRRELFDNLLEDIGVSRPQGYRCIAVFECFGKLLIDEPRLIKYFVVEALKLLSRADTPQSARDEAIQRARKSERIRIAQANELLAKHGPAKAEPVRPKKASRKKAKKAVTKPNEKSVWSFVGRTVRLILKPAQSKSPIDLESIIHDLEAALQSFRQQYAESNSTTDSQSQQVA